MYILTHLSGGLGNQLFQYALGRHLALRHNVPLKLDTTWFDTDRLRSYCLTPFNITATIASADDLRPYRLPPRRHPYHRVVNYLKRPFGKPRLVERQFRFDPSVLEALPPVFLHGYWQSPHYFADIDDIIRSEITIKDPPDPDNADIADQIRQSRAVSIHVRRTDYVTSRKTNRTHGTCDLAYYANAVRHVQKHVTSPRFFVFSDDPQWTRDNLAFDWDAVFVTHNRTDRHHEDLRLMSLCRHHITANSSFSWWGAWLGMHPDQIVIAPKKWFNSPRYDDRDLVPEHWLRV
jgi:hypothetical protein